MSWFRDLTRSAVGKKAVMAVSGIVLFGYVLLHMLGNLKLYEGPQKLDAYAGFLREVGSPLVPPEGLLWVVRAVLLVAVVLHVWSAWALTRMSYAARPVGYEKRDAVAMSYASRTMRWGGVVLLLFIVYHLLHLTTGTLHPRFMPGAVYHNVVTGLQVWWVALFYAAAQVALGLHLYHGLWSMFQTMGWNHPRYNRWRRWFAAAFAWLVTLGNLSFPLAVWSGLITLQSGP
jgi:succinate dehydrogenase / fumarate reductase cytochrome b subunit